MSAGTPLVRFPTEVADRITETSWSTGWGDQEIRTCLHGHVRMCDLKPGDAHIIAAVFGSGLGSMEWNDEQSSHEPVAEWARSAEVTDQMLADTFGPQYREVVALIRRSAVITLQEARHLATARDATAGTAARDAARNSAWDAARTAALNAAQDSAWNAARFTVWGPTRLAAGAVVVADLVGQSGLAQEHVDTLLHPVRAVLGDPLDDATVAEWLEIR